MRGMMLDCKHYKQNRRERLKYKAHGTQKPECTWLYMRIMSTAQRSNSSA
jgi:hypothetical protein